ncbi:unnamed protein product [Strongylus vulgaris]|uniref:Uncharacterized protein n=1 Tax=Strongylus vulgaris TaxID=40348 RepID=A0A3P7IIT5_STRVU|nr:unnamed protein product [Strongylus vulgaris]
MEVKVCYPTTKEADVGYLMRIVPLGEFSDDLKTFSRHKLSTHYIAPHSMNLANLSTLQEVVDFDSGCVTIASTLLCKTRPQPFECGLARRRRRGCAVEKHNSTDDEFTLVESLLRTTVVATRMKRILYKSAERDTFESVRLEKPVFVCEIPNGAMVHIGVETITSRVTSSNFLVDLKIVLPAMKKRPNSKDDSRDDSMDELSGRGGWWLNGEWLAILLISVIIGLITFAVYHLYRELRRLRRWRRSVDMFRESFKEPKVGFIVGNEEDARDFIGHRHINME